MAKEETASFADRLRSLRDAQGLSSYALAKLTGISKQSMSQLERGESQPSWQTVQLLASALGVDCPAFADPNVKPPEPQEPRPRGRPRRGADGDAEASAKKPPAKGRGKKAK